MGFGQAVLLVAQASVLARLLAGAMDGGLSAGAVDLGVLLIVLFAGGQAVAGWAGDRLAAAAMLDPAKDFVLEVPHAPELLTPIVMSIPMQLLA